MSKMKKGERVKKTEALADCVQPGRAADDSNLPLVSHPPIGTDRAMELHPTPFFAKCMGLCLCPCTCLGSW